MPSGSTSKCKNNPLPTFVLMVPTIRALTSLNISANSMATKEAGKALADALAANSVLKELNVANNLDGETILYTKTDGPAFAQELAIGLSTNGALETITFGNKQAVTMKTIMTEANFSGTQLGAAGAIVVAAFLPKCQ